jgi:hypothetical protein
MLCLICSESQVLLAAGMPDVLIYAATQGSNRCCFTLKCWKLVYSQLLTYVKFKNNLVHEGGYDIVDSKSGVEKILN